MSGDRRRVLEPGALEAAKRGARRQRRSDRGDVAVATAGRMRLARLSDRMENTEREYAARLEIEVAAGLVSEWWHESLALRLGDDSVYIPDFAVVLNTGELEIHEVKGVKRASRAGYHVEDDARVKLRACAAQYPFRVRVCYRDGVTWHRVEVAP